MGMHAQGAQRQLQGCRQRDPRLQAAGCVLQGCRLQGCRRQVAGCKGFRVGTHSTHSGRFEAAGSRIQGCRQQVARCKAAGCRLQSARGQAWARTAHTAAGPAKRRKPCTPAVWHPKISAPPACQCLQQAKPRYFQNANGLCCKYHKDCLSEGRWGGPRPGGRGDCPPDPPTLSRRPRIQGNPHTPKCRTKRFD